jgi:hypothetical protein
MTAAIDYTPPPTIKRFIRNHTMGELFYDWIIGPVGSGKTTGIFFKLIYMAKLQAPSPDGIRRTRAVVVRNTMPQLKDTTLVSWNYWFKDGQAGKWNATDKIFTLRYGDVECQVLFRPLDTPDDVARVLSLEINFAILDEFVEIPKAIIDALSARVGRYKQPDGTPVTIWGMWGSSNPSTEDNWWYDYLHSDAVLKWDRDPDVMARDRDAHILKYGAAPNTIYFHQPSGFAHDAENVENLPGQRGYYLNAAKGKTDAWVKQFIEAQWGFSISGQPVVPDFQEEYHVAKRPLQWNRFDKLIISLDPGITGSALLFGQEDYDGHLCIFKELVQEGYGAQRLIEQRLLPVLNKDFRGADFIIVPDPAAANRTQTDEGSVVQVFRRYFGNDRVDCESNNRFPLRLNAIEHYISRIGAVQIDKQGCPTLIRALKGGWRYTADIKKDILKGAEPDKNPFSHVGDAFGYLCRYFHRGVLRVERYGKSAKGGFKPPQKSPGNNYHIR